jgi:hypothetical protein
MQTTTQNSFQSESSAAMFGIQPAITVFILCERVCRCQFGNDAYNFGDKNL